MSVFARLCHFSEDCFLNNMSAVSDHTEPGQLLGISFLGDYFAPINAVGTRCGARLFGFISKHYSFLGILHAYFFVCLRSIANFFSKPRPLVKPLLTYTCLRSCAPNHARQQNNAREKSEALSLSSRVCNSVADNYCLLQCSIFSTIWQCATHALIQNLLKHSDDFANSSVADAIMSQNHALHLRERVKKCSYRLLCHDFIHLYAHATDRLKHDISHINCKLQFTTSYYSATRCVDAKKKGRAQLTKHVWYKCTRAPTLTFDHDRACRVMPWTSATSK